jgi:hypothetical protein
MTRLLMSLTLMATLAVLTDTPARAQAASYDGLWSVLIITERGNCDRGYRYAVRIKHGRVGHADPSSSGFHIQGRVARGGGIRVSVTRGDKSANGSGRMNRTSGSGMWRSAKGECSGIWTAEKRGT